MGFTIARERVPEYLHNAYDHCAKGGNNDNEIDTQEEIAKFFGKVALLRANGKIRRDTYDNFIKEFETEKQQADAYEAKIYREWKDDKIDKIKKKIAQLEADIKAFEDYQKENPKTSVANNVLNKAELYSKAGISILALGATLLIPDGGAVTRALNGWLNESYENGAIESSAYNQLRKKADYKKLEYLKRVINDPYPPTSALINATID